MKLRALIFPLGFLALGFLVAGCNGFFTNSTSNNSTNAKFAFVANSGANNIESFTVNASNGVLSSSGTTLTGGTMPVSVDANDAGTLLYAADSTSGDLAGFTINRSSSGSLTAITGTPTPTGTAPVRVAVDPGSRFVFVAATGSIHGFPITSSSSGALGTPNVTTVPADPTSARIDPSGNFLFVPMGATGLGVYKITASTAALAAVSGSPFTHTACSAGAFDVAIEPTDHFVYITDNSANVCAFSFTSSTGAMTQLGSVAFPTHGTPVGLAVDPQFTFLFVANGGASGSVAAFKINNDGTLTEATDSPFTGGSLNQAAGITTDPSGVFVYVPNKAGNNVSLLSVDSTTGKLTSQGTIAAGTAPASIVVTK